MTAAEIQRLVETLPHGHELVVLIVRSPSLPTDPASASPAAASDPPSSVAKRSPSGENGAPPVSLLEFANQALRDTPHQHMTARDWNQRLADGISTREINRAVHAAVLDATPRGTGRGHAARVISPAAMVSYLDLRNRVLNRSTPTPSWFFKVVRGGRRAND
jgi:hypothetical protein